MTNTKLLEDKIRKSGKKKSYLAERLGLSGAGFRNCMINKTEFRASHVRILCEELHINSMEELKQIFFAPFGS